MQALRKYFYLYYFICIQIFSARNVGATFPFLLALLFQLSASLFSNIHCGIPKRCVITALSIISIADKGNCLLLRLETRGFPKADVEWRRRYRLQRQAISKVKIIFWFVVCAGDGLRQRGEGGGGLRWRGELKPLVRIDKAKAEGSVDLELPRVPLDGRGVARESWGRSLFSRRVQSEEPRHGPAGAPPPPCGLVDCCGCCLPASSSSVTLASSCPRCRDSAIRTRGRDETCNFGSATVGWGQKCFFQASWFSGWRCQRSRRKTCLRVEVSMKGTTHAGPDQYGWCSCSTGSSRPSMGRRRRRFLIRVLSPSRRLRSVAFVTGSETSFDWTFTRPRHSSSLVRLPLNVLIHISGFVNRAAGRSERLTCETKGKRAT